MLIGLTGDDGIKLHKASSCGRSSPVMFCFPALKPDKTGDYRTGFGYGPEEVYNELASMINSNGEPYGYDVEEALAPAA